MAVVFGLCCVGLEVVLRIAGFGNLEIYEPHPKLYWRLKPNQDCFTKVGRKPVHINSKGTRGREFQAEKPAGTYRILMLGDSRTFGWGLNEEECYAAIVEKNLKTELKGREVEVINCGVNAWSYWHMLTFMKEYGFSWNPDLIVLGEGNLWSKFNETNSPEFVKEMLTKVRLKNFLRRFAMYHWIVEIQLQEVYSKYRLKFVPVDPNAEAGVGEDPLVRITNHIREIVSLSNQKNIPVMFLVTPMDRSEEVKAASDSAFVGIVNFRRKFAQENNLPLCDCGPELRNKPDMHYYLEADPVHFNAEGNELIATKLTESILKLTYQ